MRHNVYIRKEDEYIWNSIPSKDRSEFIHNALISKNIPTPAKRTEDIPGLDPAWNIPKQIEGKIDLEKLKQAQSNKKLNECRNGHLADEYGRCSWKGCKYAR